MSAVPPRLQRDQRRHRRRSRARLELQVHQSDPESRRQPPGQSRSPRLCCWSSRCHSIRPYSPFAGRVNSSPFLASLEIVLVTDSNVELRLNRRLSVARITEMGSGLPSSRRIWSSMGRTDSAPALCRYRFFGAVLLLVSSAVDDQERQIGSAFGLTDRDLREVLQHAQKTVRHGRTVPRTTRRSRDPVPDRATIRHSVQRRTTTGTW